eukprot:COSAG06_NODE_33411_length_490_cov_1.048593_1_plen_93_part_00
MIALPRQARDEHRKKPKNTSLLCLDDSRNMYDTCLDAALTQVADVAARVLVGPPDGTVPATGDTDFWRPNRGVLRCTGERYIADKTINCVSR